MKHLFLDESGSHNLRIVDPDYPVFVLGGVIIGSDEELAATFSVVRSFKKRIFGERPFTLHTADMQLANLVVSPIARVVLRKRTHEDYRINESKFRRSPAGCIEGAGLVILPKERGRGPLRSSQPRNQR